MKLTITLEEPEILKLEELLNAPIPNSEHLLAEVAKRAHVELEGIRLSFTSKQLEEIAYRAKKRNETPEQFLKYVVKLLEPLVFTGAGL